MMEGNTEAAAWPLIGEKSLQPDNATQFQRLKELPVKVLQVGEGNFLRGFADWMIHVCNRQGLFNGGVAVTQPRPSGKPHLDQLKAQQGVYSLLVRGIREGKRVEEREQICVFSRMIDPYSEWESFLELADGPDLEFVISNTTEAGLAYQYAEWNAETDIPSFPGKLTAFLYRRYNKFAGDPSRGLVHLPCELLERNGERLRETVLRHADDWSLPDAFKQWVNDSNRFLNTLVDRIVTGYPTDEAEELFAEWGYADPLLTTSEPYYFWAIQGERELEERLPLASAGLNVAWVEDLVPYQQRKVRILNGTHTMMAAIGLVNGLREVREALEHPAWGPKFIRGLFEEIVPVLQLDRNEMTAYANETLERFRNPFIKHKLADIAMNSLSKWKVRLLPSLKAYIERTGQLPPVLTESLASLLRLYRPDVTVATPHSRLPDGSLFQIRDDPALLEWISEAWGPAIKGQADGLNAGVKAILGSTAIWEEDLTLLPGLVDEIVKHMTKWEETIR
ncbi:tagaturonate reductase [Cohnella lupini]|uniref:Tagaturonate reductase n=1 Tax=Cohnella lupini TaxID=1294267 RepID=A0A3D9IJA0_9BACL|nr:tagaturonate reductase [Cohnella lupini]RED61808.1 tagaturonate reductase [Cohnella lupini]